MGIFSSKPSVEFYKLELSDVKIRGVIAALHSIGSNIYDDLYDKLLELPDDKPLHLYVDTHGGELLYCVKICRILRSRTHPVHVFVNRHAHSAGAIISLCANELHMKPYATLSAIDPQIALLHQFESSFPVKGIVDILNTNLADNTVSTIVSNMHDFYDKMLRDQYKVIRECINAKYTDAEKDAIMKTMFIEPPYHSCLFYIDDLRTMGVQITDIK